MNPCTLFADKLYLALAEPAVNQFVSPYGIWTALGMLLPGARGDTGARLAATLGFGSSGAFADLCTALESRAEPADWAKSYGEEDLTSYGFHLDVANSLWAQQGYTLLPDYVAELTRAFRADAQEVDFAGQPDAAVELINLWVQGKTRGRIKNVVSPASITELTRMILVNSIYFKARWAQQFHVRATRPEPFRRLGGEPIEVPTMHQQLHVSYGLTDELAVASLPYIKPELVMDIVLPHPGHFEAVARKFSMQELSLIPRDTRYIKLALPKFEVESSFQLGQPLQAVGLGDLFTTSADLSAISDEPGLHVGEVVHKTFVKVDEQGTEAAAVTAIAVAGSAMPPEPIEFTVDRPFLFLIRDVPTETVLFYGVIVDPSSKD